MKNRFWYGYLNEGNGKGTIVVFDRQAPRLPDDQVYLFHFKRNELVIYKKDIVRTKLRPLEEIEKSVLFAVDSAYFQARSIHSRVFREKCVCSELHEEYGLLSDDYDYKELQNEIIEELWEYVDSNDRSEEEGWFYDDGEDEQ
ncbi:hypothetical protein ACPF3V_003455 [Vibrio cholerae]|uniref:hypothetical protein n=1 Tax=Vibrio cholerae TaxID=666 RepID=UPI00050CD453|nr:hypothetical protein [Vibrio cholerae]EGR4265764.1 hypothetical protein [Vibrio cholerae]EGR5064185.1 hypothetical protein [Vibrio cholerae]EHE6949519.1 hypothetical protein [Vibrio cholerae]EJH4017376.1 hypothetical protein [Vibrio cholerae]EKF9092952.1 hypothetical protein [Vibrio cholerae]